VKAEFINVTLEEVYFATERMAIQFDRVKHMSCVPTCMCKLYVVFGFTLLKKEKFRKKERNL